MDITMVFVAGGAILLAVLMWLFKRKSQSSQSSQTTCSSPPAMGVMGVKPKGPPPPMPPARKTNKKYRNKKGWSAPSGHYFDDNDCLFTDAGDMIADILMIADLCGIDDYAPSTEDGYTAEECAEHEHEAAAAAEDVKEPVSEVSPSSDFSDLHTAPSAPVSAPAPAPAPSYTPEPSSYGGGDDSGGDDSGGSDD